MSRERYLAHVTLTTGDIRQSPRSEVGEGVTILLRPLLNQALQGKHAAVSGQPGYTITGGVHGRCCMVTLWRLSAAGPRMPVLHIGIAGHSRCGAELWRTLHEMAGDRLTVVTNPAKPPVTPWCADLLDIGISLEAATWTGDFSRCVAWTWIEMRGEREE